MTLALSTGRTDARPCSTCGATVSHEEFNVGDSSFWKADPHEAPCDLPCLGGFLSPEKYRGEAHGVRGKCPRCGWVRCTAEVAKEMREMVAQVRAMVETLAAKEGGGPALNIMTALADGMVLALDENDRLRAEVEALRGKVHGAEMEATGERDREVHAAEEEREGCAKLAEEMGNHDVAARIRERGGKVAPLREILAGLKADHETSDAPDACPVCRGNLTMDAGVAPTCVSCGWQPPGMDMFGGEEGSNKR